MVMVRCTNDNGWTHEGRIIQPGESLDLDEETAEWIVATMRAGEYVTDAEVTDAPADEPSLGRAARKAKG